MDTLILILIGSWSLIIIFFSAVIAPTVFKAVDENSAGLFLRAFFPKYYYFGIFLGAVSLALGIAQSLGIMGLIIISLMILLTIISIYLIPLINDARDSEEAGKLRFKRLHLLSVILNFIILILGIYYVYWGI
tara:strand:+ start:60 stop:458 length:399 start_codon:yes stop_codon:yes gene_type:complete